LLIGCCDALEVQFGPAIAKKLEFSERDTVRAIELYARLVVRTTRTDASRTGFSRCGRFQLPHARLPFDHLFEPVLGDGRAGAVENQLDVIGVTQADILAVLRHALQQIRRQRRQRNDLADVLRILAHGDAKFDLIDIHAIIE
jgi:hypothetical protein